MIDVGAGIVTKDDASQGEIGHRPTNPSIFDGIPCRLSAALDNAFDLPDEIIYPDFLTTADTYCMAPWSPLSYLPPREPARRHQRRRNL